MKQFTKRDEEFICENCGKTVGKLGYTSTHQEIIAHIAYVQNTLTNFLETEVKIATEL